ncbi:MAG: AI-2E family transporter [Campylobacterota bacterium]|nr:AI-2E family transporter [Campylobacterota bacterium]
MEQNKPNVGQLFIVAASVVVVLAGIKMAAVIVVPFLLALFLSIILAPMFLWLKKLGLGDILSLIIIVLLLFGIIGFLVALVGNSVQDFNQNIPFYEEKLRSDLRELLEALDKWGLHVPKEDIMGAFHTDSIMRYIATTLKSLGSLLTNSFLIILTITFMLMEISQFTFKLQQANKNGLRQLTEVSDDIKHYMLIKALISIITGIIIAIFLKIIGVHYAVLWGLVAFLLNFIPNIGSIIAAIPAVLMSLVQFSFGTALMVAAGYLVVNILIGSIIEPRVLGRGLGISPLVVFLSLIFWGWLLGPVGMLLSIPLTIMIKIALDSQPNTKWISTLLGSGKDAKA